MVGQTSMFSNGIPASSTRRLSKKPAASSCVKICQIHGPFEGVLATDTAFFRRMERLYPGPDFACTEDELVHNHGISSVRCGRGAFLVFDLTNRCNMKCWPCFMDANAVGHVHELDLDDIKLILERARSFKPGREINILFSGGEPTISPFFLDAIRSARKMGFKRLHVATNGIRFAQDADFAQQAREAGLHSVFLQLDGVSDESNSHRGVSNLFRVKQQAMSLTLVAVRH
jgi:7,8-dihydro-6-hydroxymethylpterin dimethyltransferase